MAAMDRRSLTIALFGGLVAPSPALACFDSANSGALIHNALPDPLPHGAVVLDASLPQEDGMSLYQAGMRIRIRRVVHGDLRGRYALLRLDAPISSCDQPLSNGRHGLVIGMVIGPRKDVPIIRPAFAVQGQGYRLSNGYQFPKGFDQPPGPPFRLPRG